MPVCKRSPFRCTLERKSHTRAISHTRPLRLNLAKVFSKTAPFSVLPKDWPHAALELCVRHLWFESDDLGFVFPRNAWLSTPWQGFHT